MSKMKLLSSLVAMLILTGAPISCRDSQVAKMQGVFAADKESIRAIAQQKVGTDNALAAMMLDKVVENAVVEFKIFGDSVRGIMFLAGQTSFINSKIVEQNDTLFVRSGDLNVAILPNERGFTFKEIQMTKLSQPDLSTE